MLFAIVLTSCEKEESIESIDEQVSIDSNNDENFKFTNLIYKQKKYSFEEVSNNLELLALTKNPKFAFINDNGVVEPRVIDVYIYDNGEEQTAHMKSLLQQIEQKVTTQMNAKGIAAIQRCGGTLSSISNISAGGPGIYYNFNEAARSNQKRTKIINLPNNISNKVRSWRVTTQSIANKGLLFTLFDGNNAKGGKLGGVNLRKGNKSFRKNMYRRLQNRAESIRIVFRGK